MTTTTWARLTTRASGAAAVAAAVAADVPQLTPHARALVHPADTATADASGNADAADVEAAAAAAAAAAPSAAAAAAIASAGMPPNLTIDPRVYKVRSYRGLWTERRKVLRGEAEADARAAKADAGGSEEKRALRVMEGGVGGGGGGVPADRIRDSALVGAPGGGHDYSARAAGE
ncbi:hypothetical protein MMPV_007305 [Pyropia vietnamensis]